MKQITRYSGVILSRNACLVQMPGLQKKERKSHVRFVYNSKAKEAEKIISSDWAENLAKSNKGVLLRSGAMAEVVDPLVST